MDLVLVMGLVLAIVVEIVVMKVKWGLILIQVMKRVLVEGHVIAIAQEHVKMPVVPNVVEFV